MSNELIKNQQQNVLGLMNDLAERTGLNNPKFSFDSRTGTAIVTGDKDGLKYTTTLQRQENGIIQTSAQMNTNIGREALISQVKELYRQGYKQQEIATMLGISQSTVHNYLKM